MSWNAGEEKKDQGRRNDQMVQMLQRDQVNLRVEDWWVHVDSAASPDESRCDGVGRTKSLMRVGWEKTREDLETVSIDTSLRNFTLK